MFRVNYQKVGAQLAHTAGGIANETRFDGEPEGRTRKRFDLPAIGGSGHHLILEQAWNEPAKKEDVVRITVITPGLPPRRMYFDRTDLEQVIFAMAQDDETLKYFKTEARSQRKHSE